jgi:hypothetical protein
MSELFGFQQNIIFTINEDGNEEVQNVTAKALETIHALILEYTFPVLLKLSFGVR